jgi:tripartite-type tricarboxylate transporter receptor subunit TctC
MVAPAGTPPAIVKRMNELTLAIVHRPELQAGLDALSVEPAALHTPADMAANMKAAREIANVSFKRANVQPN